MKKFYYILVIWLLAVVPAFGQGAGVGSAPGVGLNDEGVVQGRVQILNCVGAGVACTKSGVTGVVTITGSSSIQDEKAIYGLTYDNDIGADVTNDLIMRSGGAVDSTGVRFIIHTTGEIKQTDAAWAVGNAGCLDTGVVGNSDYYIYIIERSDTGVVDYLCSLSSTSPTMPANYDFRRLMGWYKRVAGAIVLFLTYETEGGGLELLWDAPTLDINLVNTLTTARRTDAVKVPLNLSVIAHLNVSMVDAASNFVAIVYCPDQADLAPAGATGNLFNIRQHVVGIVSGGQLHVRTSNAGLIAARANLATVDDYNVSTIGFKWSRR